MCPLVQGIFGIVIVAPNLLDFYESFIILSELIEILAKSLISSQVILGFLRDEWLRLHKEDEGEFNLITLSKSISIFSVID